MFMVSVIFIGLFCVTTLAILIIGWKESFQALPNLLLVFLQMIFYAMAMVLIAIQKLIR